MRRSLALALLPVVVLTLAFALPAAAERPLVYTEPFEATYELGLCNFPVTVRDVGTVGFKEWYDENGVEQREWVSFNRAEETLEGPTGRTLRVNLAGPVHLLHQVHYPEGSAECPGGCIDVLVFWNGPSGMIVVPGVGPVRGSSGHLVAQARWAADNSLLSWVDISHDGPVWDNVPALCAYLAGQ